MKIIEPAYQSVNLCFASNEKYAPHLATVLYSLLKNCDTKRMYDIIILHKDICREQQEKIKNMEKEGNVSVRFISMAQYEKKVEYDVGVYYSIETNYRLFLFGEMFAKYDKILYLDCDLIVEGDISNCMILNWETARWQPFDQKIFGFYRRRRVRFFWRDTLTMLTIIGRKLLACKCLRIILMPVCL